MKVRYFLPLILLLVVSSGQGVVARIEPSYLDTSPGERVELTLYVKNLGKTPIEVKSLRIRVTSVRLFSLPISTYLGEYEIPFDEPVRVNPGVEEPIKKVIRVPDVPLAGDFSLEVLVITTGGEASTSLSLRLGLTPLTAGFMLLIILLILGIVYGIYRYIKGKISREGRLKRKISRVDSLLVERGRILELKRNLEERRSEGRIGEEEYRKLKEEYDSSLVRIQGQLEQFIPEFEKEASRIRDQINRLEKEIKEIEARVEVGEIKKGAGKSMIKEKRKNLDKLRRKLQDLESRISSIRLE